MEAVGAAGSALAIVGAAGTVSQKTYRAANRFKSAPKELQKKLREADGLRVCLDAVEDVLSEQQADTRRGLCDLYKRGRAKLLELDCLIQYRLLKPGTDDEVDRLAWTRHKKDAEKLIEDIRHVRDDLSGVLSARNL